MGGGGGEGGRISLLLLFLGNIGFSQVMKCFQRVLYDFYRFFFVCANRVLKVYALKEVKNESGHNFCPRLYPKSIFHT